MANPATTKMSSRGQVVIPEEIRNKLGLTAGTQFIVIGDKDVVILKTLETPPMKEFDNLIAQARSQADQVSLQQEDIQDAIDRVKGRK